LDHLLASKIKLDVTVSAGKRSKLQSKRRKCGRMYYYDYVLWGCIEEEATFIESRETAIVVDKGIG
jgi:hypothetical protein